MKSDFEFACGTVIGTAHSNPLVNKNNQDAFHVISTGDLTITFVADGCGSSAHSEVGANLGVVLAAETLHRHLTYNGTLHNISTSPAFFEHVLERTRLDILAQLRILANAMGERTIDVVGEYFLFTLVGLVITPEVTFVFSIGDGYWGVNGEIREIGPFQGNMPPYLAYDLLDSSLVTIDPKLLKFKIHAVLDTKSITSAIVASDGLTDFITKKNVKLPGRTETLGPVSQLWETCGFFDNPDLLRRKLALANRTSHMANFEEESLLVEKGLFDDDLTVVALRRRK